MAYRRYLARDAFVSVTVLEIVFSLDREILVVTLEDNAALSPWRPCTPSDAAISLARSVAIPIVNDMVVASLVPGGN